MATFPDITVPAAGQKAQQQAAPKPTKKLKLLDATTLQGMTGIRLSQQQRAQLTEFDLLMQELAPLDPISRALVKAPFERMIGKSLPDPEEWELQKVQRETKLLTEHKALLEAKVQDIQATIFDNQDALKAYNITPDTLASEPERWVEFVKAMGSDISLGDLMRVGLLETPEQAASSELEARAKEGRERTSLAETTLKEAERIGQVASGSGEFGALANALAENVEDARGANMTWKIDTPAGSAAALDFYEQGKVSGIGQILGPKAWAEAVLQRLKGVITDNLEGLGEGGLLGTTGDVGVHDEAVFNLQTLIRATANDLGLAPADVLKSKLGLNYTGLDDRAYGAAVLKRAGGDPIKAQEFLMRYGQRSR